ncbi:MAG: SH3 domain-containing protein [Coriobacteriia bacterium]
MSESLPDRSPQSVLSGVLSKIVPWLILVIVAWVALGAYGNYRQALRESRDQGSQESTGSAESSATTDAVAPVEGDGTADGAVVVVLIDGLNMRTKPQTSAAVIKKLDKDARLTLIETSAGWYHVRDSAGDDGFVAAGGQYTKLVE